MMKRWLGFVIIYLWVNAEVWLVTFHDLLTGLEALGLEGQYPVIAHASLSAFGEVKGGAQTLVGAVLHFCSSLMMPTFTYKTMLLPEDGPPENAAHYGSGKDQNRMAQFFRPDMPVDPLMGSVPEVLRLMDGVERSNHPILSFAGLKVENALKAQSLFEPLAPIRVLMEQKGWVLLLGVDHSVNTSIHYAERLSGRRQFVRWALTPQGARECPGFPGCSAGFEQAAPLLEGITRRVHIGNAEVRALPLEPMIQQVKDLLAREPLALLCSTPDCERCNAVRKTVLYSS
jgi:aminoglycoside 3-N-acetyltransferase